MERIKANYFTLNYAIVILVILFLSLLWLPTSLIVFVAMTAVWLFLYFLRDEPIVILHRVVDDRIVLLVLSVLTIVFLLLTSATLNILVALLIGVVLVLLHAARRKTDDLSEYANRARNIHNKAVINRDPVAAQMQRLRRQIEQLQLDRGDEHTPTNVMSMDKAFFLEAQAAEMEDIKKENVRLKTDNQKLVEELASLKIDNQKLVEELLLEAQAAEMEDIKKENVRLKTDNQKLVEELASLKIDNQKLVEEIACLKIDYQNLVDEHASLKIELVGSKTDEEVGSKPQSDSAVNGCTCSRHSTCKTIRCQCIDSEKFCGDSCTCVASKCANRSPAE